MKKRHCEFLSTTTTTATSKRHQRETQKEGCGDDDEEKLHCGSLKRFIEPFTESCSKKNRRDTTAMEIDEDAERDGVLNQQQQEFTKKQVKQLIEQAMATHVEKIQKEFEQILREQTQELFHMFSVHNQGHLTQSEHPVSYIS